MHTRVVLSLFTRFFSFMALSLLFLGLVSCRTQYADYFPYHDSGLAKPRVALIAVWDHSEVSLPWNLSQKFTDAIHGEMMRHGELYLLPKGEAESGVHRLPPFDFATAQNIPFARELKSAEFIVIIEMLEHCGVPYQSGHSPDGVEFRCPLCDKVLALKMRIKVLDIRGEKPYIVAQEVLKNRYAANTADETFQFTEGCATLCTIRYLGEEQNRLIARAVERLESIIVAAH